MTRAICLMLAVSVLAGCGIKRPIMRPSEVPAYEEKLQKKQKRLEGNQSATSTVNAVKAAEKTQ